MRLWAVLIVAASGLALTPGHPAAATVPSIRLVAQTPWVLRGQEFDLQLLISPSALTGTLSVNVYDKIVTRTEFTRTMAGNISEFRRGPNISAPLATLSPDAAGVVTVRVPVQDPGKPRDANRFTLQDSGVYPVRVSVQPADKSPKIELVTHLLYVDGDINGEKLGVSWVVPVHASPHPSHEGVDTIGDQDSAALAVLADKLNSHRDLPVVLQPTPDTLAALAASPSPRDRLTLHLLADPPANRQLLAGTYVPVSLPALLTAGLGEQAITELSRGGDAIAASLNSRPDGRTWVEDGLIDDDSATFLRGAQVDRLVVPDAALSPNPLPITLTQPFDLGVGQGVRLKAAAADSGLAAHFNDVQDPVLAAHQLLAELAVIYGDAPGVKGHPRGVVVDTPRDWRPDATFLNVFVDGLTSSPLLKGVTLDTLFATVPTATVDRRGNPLVRTLEPDPRIAADAASIPAEATRSTSSHLDAFSTVLTEDNAVYERMKRMLLVSLSADLSPQARRAQLDRVDAGIESQLHLIQLPSHRKITLTARTGTLPLTVLSQADYPMQVSVRLDSDKLSFPGSGAIGSTSQTKEIRPGNNQESFTVRARTAGSFPLHISVYSPTGRLLLTSTTFTVQSTALSGVGLVLSAGAAMFLALWWGRHALKGRRARRLVHQPPPRGMALTAPPALLEDAVSEGNDETDGGRSTLIHPNEVDGRSAAPDVGKRPERRR